MTAQASKNETSFIVDSMASFSAQINRQIEHLDRKERGLTVDIDAAYVSPTSIPYSAMLSSRAHDNAEASLPQSLFEGSQHTRYSELSAHAYPRADTLNDILSATYDNPYISQYVTSDSYGFSRSLDSPFDHNQYNNIITPEATPEGTPMQQNIETLLPLQYSRNENSFDMSALSIGPFQPQVQRTKSYSSGFSTRFNHEQNHQQQQQHYQSQANPYERPSRLTLDFSFLEGVNNTPPHAQPLSAMHNLYPTTPFLNSPSFTEDSCTPSASNRSSFFHADFNSNLASNAPVLKKHICPYPNCGRTFPRSYNLKSHLLCHSGLKTHQCSMCKSAFARKHDVNKSINKLTFQASKTLENSPLRY